MSRGFLSSDGRLRQAIRAVLALLALSFGLAQAAPATAQSAKISVQAVAQAIVVTQLSFFKVDDLNFGKIIAGTTAGTVTVAPAGGRTVTGGTKTATDLTAKPARFAGKGSSNQTVAIAVLSGVSTLTRTGGTEKMTMDTFIIGSTPTATLTTVPLAFRISSTTGIFTFPVGATLHVGGNQAPGNYTGTFTITLVYQ